jgi:hypothetical protein
MASLGDVHLQEAVHRDDATPRSDRCGEEPAIGRKDGGVDATVPSGWRGRPFRRVEAWFGACPAATHHRGLVSGPCVVPDLIGDSLCLRLPALVGGLFAADAIPANRGDVPGGTTAHAIAVDVRSERWEAVSAGRCPRSTELTSPDTSSGPPIARPLRRGVSSHPRTHRWRRWNRRAS